MTARSSYPARPRSVTASSTRRTAHLIAVLASTGLLSCVQSRPLFDQDEDGNFAWIDCDDQDPAIGPRYRDLDGDGIGAGPWDAGCGLTDTTGYVDQGNDCNDQDARVSPDLPELCDTLDNNCDGLVDNEVSDAEKEELTCNGKDDNCNGMDDERTDRDGDGFTDCDEDLQPLDCEDSSDDVYPGAVETFNDGEDTNCSFGQDLLVTTAGTGACCFSGDGGSAGEALIGNVGGLARSGTILVFADAGSHRVRRINTNGVITTLAGDGNAEFAGDGGVAAAASLNGPSDVTYDLRGNLYIGDTYNHVVRMVDVTGKVSTVAGQGGKHGYSGDESPDGATKALLDTPTGVLIDDDGDLLIADTGNHRVRRVSADTGVITTMAGGSSAGYSGEDVPAANSLLSGPRDLVLIGNRRLLIADAGNHCVRLVNQGYISTYAGRCTTRGYAGDEEGRTQSLLDAPVGVAFDALGRVFIADRGNHRIRMVDTDEIIHTVAGAGVAGYSGDGGPSVEAELNAPYSMIADAAGNLVIADTGNHRLRTLFW